jgi:hypothetical protein
MPPSGTSRHFAAMQQLSRFWSETDMLRLLAAAGFTAARAAKNIGHDQTRMAFVARPGLPKPDLDPASGTLSGASGPDRAD